MKTTTRESLLERSGMSMTVNDGMWCVNFFERVGTGKHFQEIGKYGSLNAAIHNAAASAVDRGKISREEWDGAPSKSKLCERHVVLAADSITKLRSIDVYRVVESYLSNEGSTQGIVEYISQHRPDLAAEAKACEMELTEEQGELPI